MNETTDILVIGTGTSGYTLAIKCRKAGRRVAVADSRPYGGTCAMRGCQPKKYLVEAASVAEISRRMSSIGIRPPAGMDWADLMRSKSDFTDPVPERTEKQFQDAGIVRYHGVARFVAPNRVRIGEATEVDAGVVVLATGARPARLGIPGEELVTTSEEFLELERLPPGIVFVGGGFISLEFAHVARAAGSEAVVLQRGPRILKRFEEETVGQLVESSRESGIEIVTDFEVCEAEREREGLIVRGGRECGESYRADMIVHGAGRVPDLADLDLDRGGVVHTDGGVTVDRCLRSVSNPLVYAIGDAADTPFRLATTADMEAEVAAENILNGKRREADYDAIPSVVFSIPPLAGVGMTERQAAGLRIDYRVNRGRMDSWPSSRRIGQKRAFYKVIVESGSDRILGAHLFCHNAEEMINIFALAVKFGLTCRDLHQVLWSYPTSISDIKYMIT